MDIVSFLEKQDCTFERVVHPPTYSAQRLAQSLHVKGAEVAKTVLLRADDNSKFVVAVLPASKKIDLQAASRLLAGVQLHLATEIEIAARCPECEFGVLPPFGSRYGIRTIVDSALAEDEEFFFEAKSHSEAIRMKFNDYREVEKPLIGPFAVGE
jgi:Ala-tRNA(Pro) deacylase